MRIAFVWRALKVLLVIAWWVACASVVWRLGFHSGYQLSNELWLDALGSLREDAAVPQQRERSI